MEEFEKGDRGVHRLPSEESSEVINLKKIEESLARADFYIEAHRVQNVIIDEAAFAKNLKYQWEEIIRASPLPIIKGTLFSFHLLPLGLSSMR